MIVCVRVQMHFSVALVSLHVCGCVKIYVTVASVSLHVCVCVKMYVIIALFFLTCVCVPGPPHPYYHIGRGVETLFTCFHVCLCMCD